MCECVTCMLYLWVDHVICVVLVSSPCPHVCCIHSVFHKCNLYSPVTVTFNLRNLQTRFYFFTLILFLLRNISYSIHFYISNFMIRILLSIVLPFIQMNHLSIMTSSHWLSISTQFQYLAMVSLFNSIIELMWNW